MPYGQIEAAFYADMGRRIAKMRIERKLSQESVGLLVGVHRNTVMRWESGELGIDAWHLMRLADVLNCQHLFLLPAQKLIWGDDFFSMLRERDPLVRYGRKLKWNQEPEATALSTERDPKISKDEAEKLRRSVA